MPVDPHFTVPSEVHPTGAGLPVINSFTCNDTAGPGLILTGDKTLVFSWLVENADSVQIKMSTTLTGSAARAVPSVPPTFAANANPHQGSLTLSPSPLTSLFIWGARYTLVAVNSHGSAEKFIDIS